jgi:hypothetical protein
MAQTTGATGAEATGATGTTTTGATGVSGPTAASPPKDSGKYKLLAAHVISDAWLPMGTDVGTDTPYRYPGIPSTQMEGLDGPGQAAVDKLYQDLYGTKPPWDDPTLQPFAQMTPDPKQTDAEKAAAPVSYEQALEKGAKDYAGKPVTGPLPPPSPMPLSGDHSIYIGTARVF